MITEPSGAENKALIWFSPTTEDFSNLRSSIRYYPSGGSLTEINDEVDDDEWDKDVVYYCEATRNGDVYTFAQYGSVADRDNRTNALQEITVADLTSAYADSPDFAYIGVGGDGTAGQQNTYNLKRNPQAKFFKKLQIFTKKIKYALLWSHFI